MKKIWYWFLIGMIVFTLVLVCAYQLSYDRAMRKLSKTKIDSRKSRKRNRDKRICSKEEGYLSKKDGYIIVYLSDEKDGL